MNPRTDVGCYGEDVFWPISKTEGEMAVCPYRFSSQFCPTTFSIKKRRCNNELNLWQIIQHLSIICQDPPSFYFSFFFCTFILQYFSSFERRCLSIFKTCGRFSPKAVNCQLIRTIVLFSISSLPDTFGIEAEVPGVPWPTHSR